MLVLSRKEGQEIVIGDCIRLTVLAIHGNRVHLGFAAPQEVSIRREELAPKAEDFGALAVPPSATEGGP